MRGGRVKWAETALMTVEGELYGYDLTLQEARGAALVLRMLARLAKIGPKPRRAALADGTEEG